MATGSYRDLRVWNEAIELVEHVYRVTQEFPKHETFGLTSQMQRAAISVPANIAEGNTREHRKEYLHHVALAQASLAELGTHLEIAARLGLWLVRANQAAHGQSSIAGKATLRPTQCLEAERNRGHRFEGQEAFTLTPIPAESS